MVNKIILIGFTGKDPEVTHLEGDRTVAKFSLATSESYKNKQGEKVTDTEWHSIVVWRGLAKVVEKYVKKGDKLYIEGKLTHRKYEKDGQTKYYTEIVCRDLKMLGSKESGSGSSSSSNSNSSKTEEPDVDNFDDIDDLPF